jgi:tetratricopeptide (TPR) repeat protein
VLVRAHIAGKTYYLDGTRTGDLDLDDIQIPNFGWGLPLVPDAQLVHLLPPPFPTPHNEAHLDIDASTGIYATAPATAEIIFRGDEAVILQTELNALTQAQRDQYLQAYWKKLYNIVTYKSGTTSFDKGKRELDLTMTGEAKLDWVGGLFHVPNSGLGFAPDFNRPDGPSRDAPFAVAYPVYVEAVTQLRVPPSFVTSRNVGAMNVHETIAGVEYDRNVAISGNTLSMTTSQRSLVPEISASDARAAETRLRTLADEDISIRIPGSYRPTAADLAVLNKTTLDSASEYFTRAGVFFSSGRMDQALSDLNAGLAIEPNNESALARRAQIYLSKHEYDSAAKDVDAIESIDPANPGITQARATIAAGKGDYKGCVEGYTKVLARSANNFFFLGHRAICEQGLGNDETALADSAVALKAMPSWLDLRVLRANIFMREGKRDLVSKEAEAATRENPYSNYAFVVAAKTYAALGDRDRAMRFFARALALKPEAYIYVNRAQVRLESDTAGRLADLNEALKLDPGNVDALKLKEAWSNPASSNRAASQQAAVAKH